MNTDLLHSSLAPFNFIEKYRQPDGEGGITTVWSEGAEFKAHARLDNSIQAKIAEQQGVTSIYTITTTKSVTLMNNDVIRRKEDGAIFRITSNGTDNKTPDSAGLDMRQVSAELWALPND